MAKTTVKDDKREKALKAIKELTSEQRIGVVVEALSDQEMEDLIDHIEMEEAKKHPRQKLEDYLSEFEGEREEQRNKKVSK